MKPARCLILVVLCVPSVAIAGEEVGGDVDAERYWPQWRGPRHTGEAPHADPPVSWSERKNIRWKIKLPGKGHSTPIVWGDQVFVTTAVPYGETFVPKYSGASGAHDNVPVSRRYQFAVLALGRRDGALMWRRDLCESLPHEGGHETASLASNSPVTDGEHVYACFGSRGLYCLDFDGALHWGKDFGRMMTKHGHGEGSSPVLYGDTLVLNWDHEGQSFVVALDKRSGEERWRAIRDEPTSWATPIIVEHAGTVQVIVSGTRYLRGYDLATGQVIWKCGGLSANIVASPVPGHGMVIAGSSYEIRAMLAVRLQGARGDLTGTEWIAWTRRRGTPYVPSPLLYGDALYFLAHYQNVLTRVDPLTGENRPGPFRLHGIGNVYASPVGAANRVYITDLGGNTVVISHQEETRMLSFNRLDDRFSASPALVDREIFFRGERYLYCIAEEE